MLRQGLGFPFEQLVWIDAVERDDGSAMLHYFGTAKLTYPPTLKKGRKSTPHKGYDFGSTKDMGYLPDGNCYEVYCFALYMYGFK